MFEILALNNIELAVRQGKANKGSAGVEGMKVYELGELNGVFRQYLLLFTFIKFSILVWC